LTDHWFLKERTNMKDVREDDLFRLSMQPELSPEEESKLEAWLAAHPDARAAWEADRALGRVLQALPDTPVSSNFTARVMQQLDLAEAQERRKQGGWRLLWPRLGWTTAALALAVFGAQQFRSSQRTQLVFDAALVSKDIARLPDAFRDFDVVESLRQIPPASDDGILIALQ
jgi:ferric-dicitrate binding protein FerR (iron transport regulator)